MDDMDITKKDMFIAGGGSSALTAFTYLLTQTIPLLLMIGVFYFIFFMLAIKR